MENNSSFHIVGDSEALNPSVTLPNNGPLYHFIEDKELESIMKLENSNAALIAYSCFGYIIGQIQFIGSLISRVLTDSRASQLTPMSMTDLINFGVVVAAVVLTGVYGLTAFRTKSATQITLEKIRNRAPINLKLNSDEPQGS